MHTRGNKTCPDTHTHGRCSTRPSTAKTAIGNGPTLCVRNGITHAHSVGSCTSEAVRCDCTGGCTLVDSEGLETQNEAGFITKVAKHWHVSWAELWTVCHVKAPNMGFNEF